MSPHRDPQGHLPLEQQAIRARCWHPSRAFAEFTREAIEQSIAQRFAQQIDQYPQQPVHVPGYMTFGNDDSGQFQFGAVHGYWAATIIASCGAMPNSRTPAW